MSSGLIDSSDLTHPLVRLVGMLEGVLDDGVAGPAWTFTPRELTDLVPRLAVLGNRLDGVLLRMLREADRLQVGGPVGAANTAGWFANTTRTIKPAAHRLVALAEALDDDTHAVTASALGAGVVSVEQAAVIVQAVDVLPRESVTAELRTQAESHLVGLAEHHDPKDLRVLGRKILEVIAPQIVKAHEQKILENEERHALTTASFSMRPDRAGSMLGRFKIPVLAGEILAKHLAAIAAPNIKLR